MALVVHVGTMGNTKKAFIFLENLMATVEQYQKMAIIMKANGKIFLNMGMAFMSRRMVLQKRDSGLMGTSLR